LRIVGVEHCRLLCGSCRNSDGLALTLRPLKTKVSACAKCGVAWRLVNELGRHAAQKRISVSRRQHGHRTAYLIPLFIC
jgi:hypothetical protein